MPEDFGARSSFVAPANTDAKIWRLVERAARPKGRPAAACGRCGLVYGIVSKTNIDMRCGVGEEIEKTIQQLPSLLF